MVKTIKITCEGTAYKPIAELQDFQGNLKTLDKKALGKLKRSILKYGFSFPVFVWGSSLLDGHQRIFATKELIKEGYEIGDIPVVEIQAADKKEAGEKLLALNSHYAKMTEDGLYDFIQDMDINFSEMAEDLDFPDIDLDGFLDEPEAGSGNTGDDDVPDVPEEPVTKLGDVWLLDDKHRILCGDSTDAEQVAVLMDGGKATLVHADPPYGMGKENDGVINDNLYCEKLDAFQMQWWKAFRPHIEDNGSVYIWGNAEDLWRLWYAGGLKDSERLTFRNEIVWDKKYGQGMESERHRMFPTASERCLFFILGEQGFNNNADNYWHGWDSIVNYLKKEKAKSGLTVKDFKRIAGHSEKSGCHWFDKSQWMMPTKETYQAWQKELIGKTFKREYDDLKREYDDLKREFYATRAYFDNIHDKMTDVWQFERVQGEERYGHATPKPVDMISRAVKSSCEEGGIVTEPFLGSGSTLIAAQKTGRRCFGCELDEHYCDVVVERWQNYTGKQATLEATGQTFNELKDRDKNGN